MGPTCQSPLSLHARELLAAQAPAAGAASHCRPPPSPPPAAVPAAAGLPAPVPRAAGTSTAHRAPLRELLHAGQGRVKLLGARAPPLDARTEKNKSGRNEEAGLQTQIEVAILNESKLNFVHRRTTKKTYRKTERSFQEHDSGKTSNSGQIHEGRMFTRILSTNTPPSQKFGSKCAQNRKKHSELLG